MTLTGERLDTALRGRPFRFFNQIGSTNDEALRWLGEGVPSGSLVAADEQTHGRGRLGRTWYAPLGTALMVSYLLRPAVEDVPYVPMMGGLAVCETLSSLGVERVGLKWPNDVQIDGRKVCGVLPEVAWHGEKLIGVALGIGLNVRVDFAGTALAQTAISLEDAIGRVDRLDVLVRLLTRLDHWSARLGAEELYRAWRSRLTMIGQAISIQGVTGTVQGVAERVDRHGALWVRRDDESVQRVVAGDLALG
jgi:BirA family biotin operon repressor/biotin-[acetyl-CoA-carboxylase] ligase